MLLASQMRARKMNAWSFLWLGRWSEPENRRLCGFERQMDENGASSLAFYSQFRFVFRLADDNAGTSRHPRRHYQRVSVLVRVFPASNELNFITVYWCVTAHSFGFTHNQPLPAAQRARDE